MIWGRLSELLAGAPIPPDFPWLPPGKRTPALWLSPETSECITSTEASLSARPPRPHRPEHRISNSVLQATVTSQAQGLVDPVAFLRFPLGIQLHRQFINPAHKANGLILTPTSKPKSQGDKENSI